MNFNDSYQEACQQTRWFLRALALLPHNLKSSILSRLIVIEMRIIHIIILLWIIVTDTIHMILYESDKNKKIFLIGPISYVGMSFLKFCAIYWRGKIIDQCMKHINDDWIQIKNQKHRELMRKNMHWGKRATMACSVLMYAGAVSYNIIMPASEHILSHASGRMPAFPGYDVAFDAQDSPIYEIMLIGYLYGAFIAHTVTICSNHLAILSVSHVYGQLEILEDYIRGITNAVKFNKPQSVHVEIATIVSHHCRITKFLKAVKKVLYEICLIDVLVSTLLICLGEYSILQMWRNQELVSVVSCVVMTLGLAISPFIFCWISEILSEQFFNIATLVYNADWYKIPNEDQKCLVLIFMSAQRPQKIDAGVMELSFMAFTSIVKTAVGYLQMLRAMST